MLVESRWLPQITLARLKALPTTALRAATARLPLLSTSLIALASVPLMPLPVVDLSAPEPLDGALALPL